MIRAIIFDFFDVFRTDGYNRWLKQHSYGREGAFLTASVFPFYGAATMVCAALSAALCEVIYNFVFRILPRRFFTPLRVTDAKVDYWADMASWKMFGDREWKGLLVVFALFTIYFVLCCVELIA